MSLPLEYMGAFQSLYIKDLGYRERTSWGGYCFLWMFNEYKLTSSELQGLIPAKSGSQCAGKENEAKAWSTTWDAPWGTVPGAAT
jgi:hypothetical protein